jgi:hypothetical protein
MRCLSVKDAKTAIAYDITMQKDYFTNYYKLFYLFTI